MHSSPDSIYCRVLDLVGFANPGPRVVEGQPHVVS